MGAEILNEISTNMNIAVQLHKELADAFWFISMEGYAMLHEKQNIEEGIAARRLRRYITSTYHIAPTEVLPSGESSIAALTKGLSRKKLDTNTICDICEKCWNKHMDWEERSLRLYQDIAVRLFNDGEISAFNYVGGIIADTKAEIAYVTNKVIELNGHDFDMAQITAEQPDYYERYSHLISRLFSGRESVEKLHHWNSALDQESRVVDALV